MSDVALLPLRPEDRDWVERFVAKRWGAAMVVAHGTIYYPHELPGFAAVQVGERVGLVTYRIEGERCEIVTLDSLRPSSGVGTALIEAVKQAARCTGCTRLWLTTTNDNVNALRFYQKRGFALVTLRPNALALSRRLKPEIPLIGGHGIPLRDELDLAMELV